MGRFGKVLLLIALFCAFNTTRVEAHGGGIECLRNLAAEKDATDAFNTFMAQKYPKLKFMLKDPDAFIAKMKLRFQEYKKLHPDSPHNFDYSEFGMPLAKSLNKNLLDKIAEMKSYTGKKIRDSERTVYLQYLSDLQAEAQKIVDRGSVAYREIIEFNNFYSRAIGHFDTREFRWVDRNFLKIDRALEGYKQLSIVEEYALYKRREFNVFQMKSSSKGFAESAQKFEDAFKDTTELRGVWIPTDAYLERDVLMRLMWKDVHIVGTSDKPILADGFLRPGGDFGMHDIRHESAKYYEKYEYIAKHNLNEYQVGEMSKKVDEWALELASATSRVKDHDLEDAIIHLAFSFNHDRGYPLIPSVFIDRKKNLTAHALYVMMIIGKQGVPYGNPIVNSQKAAAWLKKFWLNRLAEEEAILAKRMP